eukprot:1188932-Prorocentrum_minimum.AAC.1
MKKSNTAAAAAAKLESQRFVPRGGARENAGGVRENAGGPFEWQRRQFPVQVALALSINKVQGQSLELVGIDLTDPCFANGQNYVAASQVGGPKHVRYFIPDATIINGVVSFSTRNVVYPDILRSFA